ncbi:MAG: gliding motility-associated C-terminal domain-containing protein [Flavobacteriales bacterium]|nr:gliding motility-associated C-terminal domain-containing protein [Flavobacteriales bacterium]
MSFNNGTGNALTFNVTDNSGSVISSGASANGLINLNGLCSVAYLLEVTEGGNANEYVFNIPTNAIDPGDAIADGVCSTDPNQNFNTAITGLAAGGQWTNPNNQPQSFPIAANATIDGWYAYTIPSGGCDVITGVYVTTIQNADPGNSTTYLICEDYVPFEMVNFLSGSPDLGGTWFNAQGNPVSGTFNPATQNSAVFTYMIDNVPGCGAVFSTLFVDENQNPDAGDNASIEVCQGGTPFNMFNYLGGSPEAGGQWYNPLNAPVSAMFDPSTSIPGNYRYHVNGLTPCVDDNAFLNITFIDPDPAGENASISVCESGANVNMFQQLNGSPLAGGYWTDVNGQTTNGVYDPQNEAPGNYYYNYPNIGCPQSATLTILLELLPNAGPDNNISVCENLSSLNLNGQLSAGTDTGGQWTDISGNQVSNIFTPQSGINQYSFQYHAEGNICPDDQSTLSITLEALPDNPQDIDLSFCYDAPVVDLQEYYPTFPAIVFELPNGNSYSGIFDPAVSSDATIMAVQPSGNSCPDGEGEINIDVILPLFDNTGTSVDVCITEGVFDLSGVDPDANANNGIWYDNNGVPIDEMVDITPGGLMNFQFVANDAGGCGGYTYDVELEIFDGIEAGENANAIFCATDSPELLTNLLPASNSGLGSWYYQGQPFNDTQFDPTSDPQGSYLYVVPANGPCPSDAAELSVEVQPAFTVDAGEDHDVCAGAVNFHIGSAPLPSTVYTWSPSQFLSSVNLSQPVVQVPASISTDLSIAYQVFADNGVCSASDEVVVGFHPLPVADIGDLYEICSDEELNIGSNGNGDYQWAPQYLFEDPTLPVQHLVLSQDAVISVVVTNEYGCVASDTAEVVVHPEPVIVFIPEPYASCSPLDVEYAIEEESQNIQEFYWNISGIGDFTEDTLRTTITESGLYTLTIFAISDFGCENSVTFPALMEVYPSPVADFSTDPLELSTIDPIAQFVDESIDAETYWWNFSGLGTSTISNPLFEFPAAEPTNFNVCLEVTNSYGCMDSICRILHLDNDYIFFAPNAITPDNDGINDHFSPVMMGFEESTYSLEIFNRWGDRIFFTTEYGKPWNANVHDGGYYVQEDVYIWQVKVKDKENAEYRTFRGNVTVIR